VNLFFEILISFLADTTIHSDFAQPFDELFWSRVRQLDAAELSASELIGLFELYRASDSGSKLLSGLSSDTRNMSVD
jgi:hypothetical protein